MGGDIWFKVLVLLGVAVAVGVSVYAFYTISKRYQYGGHLYTQLPKAVQSSQAVFNSLEHVVFYDTNGNRRVYVLDPVNSSQAP